jgi:formamidopyrimidine-DNA glycosylase
MSGNWIFTDLNTEKPKHSHFTILLENCNIHMVDPRRFAKWKIGGRGQSEGFAFVHGWRAKYQ